ncbi:phospholipase A2 [Paractinoplanes hotanensis]|uniref:Phospholipase n=1 Tax=Paractinoplanes hotanensis TaxID=2906497 RepID=A0ABT0YC48_9ACTN|nr:phospholipase A2 [Actinoplanes hotanensis]MCM4083621.1 phospholipase [Actinoplanes hotanensis]
MVTTLLIPQHGASAAEPSPQPAAQPEVQQIGPGIHLSADDSYRIFENDVPAGLMGRSHAVAGQDGNTSRARDAPVGRPDLKVFGPSWEARFLGGQLNRRLTPGSREITTTDLVSNKSFRYKLTRSIAGADGGNTRTYLAIDGSTLVETTKSDALTGRSNKTLVETLNVDLTTTQPGDDAFVDESGKPIPAPGLQPSYTWKQVSSGDWRITAVGNKAHKGSTISYDRLGRVSTISEPVRGDTPARSLNVNYATVTTASGARLGDVSGQAKDITLTVGQTARTLARYFYDSSTLLREVTNPAAGTDLNNYTYDSNGRVSTVVTDGGARWALTYTSNAVVPQARQTGWEATDGEFSAMASSPSYCNTASSWMYGVACSTHSVAHYGWRGPVVKFTGGIPVVGLNHDHCTSAPDNPFGFDFNPACDSHDFGYGIIGNSYFPGFPQYLDRGQKGGVDAEFYNMLYNFICPKYGSSTSACRGTAWVYYTAVGLGGNPVNGARATGCTVCRLDHEPSGPLNAG